MIKQRVRPAFEPLAGSMNFDQVRPETKDLDGEGAILSSIRGSTNERSNETSWRLERFVMMLHLIITILRRLLIQKNCAQGLVSLEHPHQPQFKRCFGRWSGLLEAKDDHTSRIGPSKFGLLFPSVLLLRLEQLVEEVR